MTIFDTSLVEKEHIKKVGKIIYLQVNDSYVYIYKLDDDFYFEISDDFDYNILLGKVIVDDNKYNRIVDFDVIGGKYLKLIFMLERLYGK